MTVKAGRTLFRQAPDRFLSRMMFAYAVLATGRAMAAGDDPVRDAAARAVKKLDLQVSLPHQVTDADLQPNWHLPGELIYVLAAIAAALLVYMLIKLAPRWRSHGQEDWATTGGDGFSTVAAAADIGLSQADELAARGFFVEAMHLLLLHSLAEIRRRLKLEFADSLTSREILRRARLPDEVSHALRSIVTRVELSYFGGYPAGQPDYDSCRTGFETLSSVLAGGKIRALPEMAG